MAVLAAEEVEDTKLFQVVSKHLKAKMLILNYWNKLDKFYYAKKAKAAAVAVIVEVLHQVAMVLQLHSMVSHNSNNE